MKSLAEALGVNDLEQPELPTPPEPMPLTARNFARSLLDTRQYRESFLRRVVMDELPPAVEVWLLNTAYGKPVERVEIEDTTVRLEDAPPSHLEARSLALLEQIRRLRAAEERSEPATIEGSIVPDDDPSGSVH